MADSDVAGLNTVFEPVVTDIDVAGFRAGRGTAIGGEANSAFIVLFEEILLWRVTLFCHESCDPYGVGKVVTYSN